MGGLRIMLLLLAISALTISTSAQGGSGPSSSIMFQIRWRCIISSGPLALLDQSYTTLALQRDLKDLFVGRSLGNLGNFIPEFVEILIIDEGLPAIFDVILSFNEEATPVEQAAIFGAIDVILSSGRDNIIASVNGTDVVHETTVTCGADTSTLSFDQLAVIQDLVANCPCLTDPREPSCGPIDDALLIHALTETLDYLLGNALRQENLIEQLRLRCDALEELLDAEVNSLQDQINALLGVDRNLTGISSSLFDSIQELRNDVEDLQNKNQILMHQNQIQERQLDDLDSLSRRAWALGIAGLVFGCLALVLLVIICVCLCCPGNPFFASPRRFVSAPPHPPIYRPVINGPVIRRPRVPAACNMARFGVGRMQPGPLSGCYR